MKMFLKNLLAIYLMVVLQACSNGDRNGRDETAKEITDTMSDTTRRAQTATADVDLNGDGKMFVSRAASGGMMEVEAAGLALKRSKNKSVKDFAAQMLKDHSKVNEELRKIADEKGIQLAQTLPAEHSGHLDEMNTLADRAFDVQYLRMMINDHKSTVQLFTDGSRLADPKLKAFSIKTLPVIQDHYNKAIAIGKNLNINNANNGDDVLGLSPAKIENK